MLKRLPVLSVLFAGVLTGCLSSDDEVVESTATATTPPTATSTASPVSSETPSPTSTVVADSPLNGTVWRLIELAGEPFNPAFGVTLVFAAGEISGFSGCNEFSAMYDTETDGALSIDVTFTTDAGCPGPLHGINFQERYYDALETSVRYFLDSPRLALHAADDATLLLFESLADTASALDGTSWRLIELAGEPVDLEVGATLLFGRNMVSGFSGCNAFGAFYALSNGAGIEIQEVMSNAAGCSEPLRSMNFEARYYAALTGSVRYFLDSPRLALHAADDATLLLFEPIEN